MTSRVVLEQAPSVDDPVLAAWLARFVGDTQRALDDASDAARLGVVLSGVTAPVTFNASTATLAQTASMVGALYGALKVAGKIS